LLSTKFKPQTIKGKWNSITLAVYLVGKQLYFARERLRLKFLPQIWQRSDLGPLYSLDLGHRRPSQKKAHTERLMQLACCADAGQFLGQGESL